MAQFSERIGAVQPRTGLQINGMSNELRNSLWNVLYRVYHYEYWETVARYLAENFAKTAIDDLPEGVQQTRNWVRGLFYNLSWFSAYDFIEFAVNHHSRMTTLHPYGSAHEHRVKRSELIDMFNSVLRRELSAYFFVSGILTPISNATEGEAISTAIESAGQKGLVGAREHLTNALVQLGKKPTPDYRNSIKESISAVESVAKQISGAAKSKGLDQAIDRLSEKAEIHGALKAGFKSLYGYTSDEGGIRHAILEMPNVGFAEAKYMLVSCSAFVHYLIQKADDAHLL